MIAGYVGTDPVERIYLGSELVWSAEQPIDYRSLPFTYEFETPQTLNQQFFFAPVAYLFSPGDVTLAFYDENGDLIRKDSYDMADMYGGPQPMVSVSNVKKMEFCVKGEVHPDKVFIAQNNIPGNYKVYGNILSLAYGENFANYTDYPSMWTGFTSSNNGFFGSSDAIYPIFTQNPYGITDASHLVFPDSVFNSIYRSMFSGCTSLTTAPELPATTLSQECYNSMFSGCVSLTTAPALPATTLADGCYSYMFAGCSGLTSSPVLPATQPVNDCYRGMFSGCPLTSITCNLLVDANFDYNNTLGWNRGAEQFGVFRKNPNSTWKTNSQVFADTYAQDSGVPDDWTVEDI